MTHFWWVTNFNSFYFQGWGNIVKVYGDVQEVDLYVGMLMEEPVPGMDSTDYFLLSKKQVVRTGLWI